MARSDGGVKTTVNDTLKARIQALERITNRHKFAIEDIATSIVCIKRRLEKVEELGEAL